MPHKLAALELCDDVDDFAHRAGAVNTIVFHADRIQGSNTDGLGFAAALKEAGVDPGAGPALILGAGGAARAIAAALLSWRAPVSVANRTRVSAEMLGSHLPRLAVIDWERREQVLAECALLVNATSLGMDGQPPLVLDLSRAPSSLVVAETVYTPLETALLAVARARGLRTVDGLGMLLHQARPGFAAWFGAEPVVDTELRRFILADLRAE
jgi:shikimate dehydrogenase